MNAPSPWQRPLQLLAAALAITIAGLFVLWIDLEPRPPSPAEGRAGDPRATAVLPAAASGDGPGAAAAAADRSLAAVSDTSTTGAAPQPAVLFGTVRGADGTALTDGVMWLYRDGKHVGTQTLRTGTFAFAGLRPGVHRLVSRIPDELPLDRDVQVDAPATRLDLELAARWLLRVDAVTADGTPLRDAAKADPLGFRNVRALAFRAPLTGDLPGDGHPDTEAGLGPFRSNDPFGMRGQKALPKQTVGVLALPSDGAVHVALVFGTALLAQQQATPGQESLAFVLPADALQAKTGTVRLRCVDGAGAPVAGVRVQVGSGSGMTLGNEQGTGADGRYAARGLMPGRVTFHAWHEKLRLPPIAVDLAAAADVDLGDVVMQPVVEVELSFAGFGGNGSVRTFLLDVPPGARWRSGDSYLSEQNGAAQKLSLYPGRHAVLARGKNGAALFELDTAALQPGPLQLDLRPAASLRIDGPAGERAARYSIATTRGATVAGGSLRTGRGFAIELPPGEYRVTVDTGSGAPHERTVTLPPEGATLTLP